jgi:alpha-beta hydrolase superfamily lysophospholipase
MNHKEGTFKNDNGIDIYYQCWLPEEEEKAVLLVVHGLGEHIGRYMNLVNYLTPQGFAVCGLDHQGHGKSGGEREMVESFDDFTHTLSIFHKMVTGWHEGKPIFLVGNSMGGIIAAYYLLEHQSAFKGAVLLSPAFKPNIPRSTLIMGMIMGGVLSRLTPRMGIWKVDPSGVSRDQQVVQDYISDPLVHHGEMPVRLGFVLSKSTKHVLQVAGRITLPIIVLHGEADSLVSPEGAQMFYDKAGSEDKTMKIYPGLYHELLNEPEKNQVFADLETWLERQLRT